jgi:hypothetical protein
MYPDYYSGKHDDGKISDSVELDAIDSPILRRMVRELIERHIDWEALARTREVGERKQLPAQDDAKGQVDGEVTYGEDRPRRD